MKDVYCNNVSLYRKLEKTISMSESELRNRSTYIMLFLKALRALTLSGFNSRVKLTFVQSCRYKRLEAKNWILIGFM